MSELALPTPRSVSQGTVIEQTRAVAEVAAMVRVAQDNRRDMTVAIEEMRMSCSQPSLAARAFYSLPRAGGRVEGSTVHLARELARCFGNIQYGMKEMSRDDKKGESEVLAYAWDVEKNARQERTFIVPHQRMARGARQDLTDLSEIANNNNSVAARALRECILTLLPVWFRDEAEALAAKTLNGDATAQPLPKRIADALEFFNREFNVTPAQIEARLARPRSRWTAGDLTTLNVIGSEILRGEKVAEDEFPEQPLDLAALPTGHRTEAGDGTRTTDDPAPSGSHDPAAPVAGEPV